MRIYKETHKRKEVNNMKTYYRVYAPNSHRAMYLTRIELEKFCKNVLVNEFTQSERENNIRNYLNNYTLSQNATYNACRILREIGYRVER